jgi:hypothetical protein
VPARTHREVAAHANTLREAMSVPSGINRDVWTEEDERDPNGWDVIDANARLHQRIRVAFDQC